MAQLEQENDHEARVALSCLVSGFGALLVVHGDDLQGFV